MLFLLIANVQEYAHWKKYDGMNRRDCVANLTSLVPKLIH